VQVKAKIYTKTGDKGQTSLVGGTRVPKTHARLEAYGTLDELNSVIGLVRSALMGEYTGLDRNTDSLRKHVEMRLQGVQNALFNMGSRLACETESLRPQLPNIDGADIEALETDMDTWESDLPPLKNFILPGGSQLAAFAHLARTVCRRGERCVLRLDGVETEHLVYLNRLSDWLFLLARKFNSAAGVRDVEWT
jgi:cob(I)alamin adenosyltransferase